MRLALLFSLAMLTLGPAVADAASPGTQNANEQLRQEVRRAVQAHRAQERDEIQREEAAAGRHLTPAERAELREQVRREWTRHPDADQARTGSVPAPAPARP